MKRGAFNHLTTCVVYLVLVILLSQLLVAQAATSSFKYAQLTELPLLQITLLNQEPDPVSPGDFVELRVMVENIGGTEAKNIEVEILPTTPFTLYQKDAIIQIGQLQGRQMSANGAILRYKLRVDDSTIDGDYDLRFRYRLEDKYGKTNWVETDDYTLRVRAEQPFLSLAQVSNTTLIPGKTTPLTFTLKNDAQSTFKNIEVTLNLDGTPFKPVGSGNIKSIGRIKSQETGSVEFLLSPLFDAKTGITDLPITLTFSDDAGNNYTRDETIGIPIFDTPAYLAAIEQTTVYSKGTKGTVVLSISNTGQAELKFTSAKLVPSNDYEIIGPKASYLGNVESDNFETGEFTIYPYAKNDFNLTFELSYKDVFNNEYVDTITLPLALYSSSELKNFGLNGSSNTLGRVIAIIIILALIYYGYRRWEKKKKNDR